MNSNCNYDTKLLTSVLITIADSCSAPLGMEDNKIADGQIIASSEWSSSRYHGVKNARLNGPAQLPDSVGAWCAAGRKDNQWIQVDLMIPTWITGVMTQGREDTSEWVKQYKVEYSSNGQNWTYVQSYDDHKEKVS